MSTLSGQQEADIALAEHRAVMEAKTAQAVQFCEASMTRCNALVTAAAARIYAAWLPHIGDVEARQQAHAFVRHFQITERAAS